MKKNATIGLILISVTIIAIVGCAIYSRENKVFFPPGDSGEQLYHQQNILYIGLSGFADDAATTESLLVATHFEQPVTTETTEMGISIGGVVGAVIELVVSIFK